jgi:hyperosmotically inducible periplasmic protein
MKKLMSFLVAGALLIATAESCKKKPSDADLQASIQKALTDKGMAGTTVSVSKGVATLSGLCKDEMCKAECEAIAKGVKGIDKVENTCTVASVVQTPASTTTSTLDPKVQKNIMDGTKDIAGLKVSFSGNKAVFTGEVSAANKMKVAQMCASAKVAADMSAVKVK